MARTLFTNYTFENGTRVIHLPLTEMSSLAQVRLIINETQKVVICSSMQKDLVTSFVRNNVSGGWDLTYTSTLPALATGDELTVELDMSDMNYMDGTDFILKAKMDGVGGEAFDVGPQFGAKIADVVNSGGSCAYMFANTAIRSFVMQKEVDTRNNQHPLQFFNMFAGCPNLVSADFSGLKGLQGSKCWGDMFGNCPSLESVDFSNLEWVNGNDGYNDTNGGMFRNCTSLRSVSFPKLAEKMSNIPMAGFFIDMCNGCTNLESFSLPLVSYWSNYNGGTLANCPNLVTVHMHPGAFGFNNYLNPISPVSSLVNLTFSADASNHIYLIWNPNLSAASVKHVLTRSNNANMSGKTISFYTNGLTIQDDAEGSIQTLYDAVVAQGATIANLTITPYSNAE